MKIYSNNLRSQFPLDGTAKSVLECLVDRISPKLFEDIKDALCGYSEDMQLEIADDLLDCACKSSLHYTGIKHVDNLLKGFYLLIAEEVGIPLSELTSASESLPVHQQTTPHSVTVILN